MKKIWEKPVVNDISIKQTKEGICVNYQSCSSYIQPYKNHGDNDDQNGHIPGKCQFTCIYCGGCTKPGNSPNHNQCPACNGSHQS